jgi:hypothetical protein
VRREFRIGPFQIVYAILSACKKRGQPLPALLTGAEGIEHPVLPSGVNASIHREEALHRFEPKIAPKDFDRHPNRSVAHRGTELGIGTAQSARGTGSSRIPPGNRDPTIPTKRMNDQRRVIASLPANDAVRGEFEVDALRTLPGGAAQADCQHQQESEEWNDPARGRHSVHHRSIRRADFSSSGFNGEGNLPFDNHRAPRILVGVP